MEAHLFFKKLRSDGYDSFKIIDCKKEFNLTNSSMEWKVLVWHTSVSHGIQSRVKPVIPYYFSHRYISKLHHKIYWWEKVTAWAFCPRNVRRMKFTWVNLLLLICVLISLWRPDHKMISLSPFTLTSSEMEAWFCSIGKTAIHVKHTHTRSSTRTQTYTINILYELVTLFPPHGFGSHKEFRTNGTIRLFNLQ